MKVKVSKRALRQRLQRTLKKKGLLLRAVGSRRACRYVVVDPAKGRVIGKPQSIEALGLSVGVAGV
jgi:hypothetical protein